MAKIDFDEQYKGYENTLNSLREQCAQAEKNVIVAETTIKTLTDQRSALIKECETFMGMKMEDIPAALDNHKKELEGIMDSLSGIDLEGEITKDTLASIEGIVAQYGI